MLDTCFGIRNFTRLKLIPSFLLRQKREDDVGFASVCCKYVFFPLVNKEAALDYSSKEYNKVKNPSRDRGGKKVESRRCHVADEGERQQNLNSKSQPHGNTQIKQNGLI